MARATQLKIGWCMIAIAVVGYFCAFPELAVLLGIFAVSLLFVSPVEGVGPTNNAAERALRHAAIWRRISGGTDGEAGSRFVERMLSVGATCRQQGRGVLGFPTACHRSRLDGTPTPPLLA